MDKPGSPSLPSWMLLILALCLIGLAGHFVMDGLGSSSAEPAGHYDDLFVAIAAPLFLASLIWIKVAFHPGPFQQFICRPPLLPPPNH